MAAASDRHAARVVFLSVSILIAEYGRLVNPGFHPGLCRRTAGSGRWLASMTEMPVDPERRIDRWTGFVSTRPGSPARTRHHLGLQHRERPRFRCVDGGAYPPARRADPLNSECRPRLGQSAACAIGCAAVAISRRAKTSPARKAVGHNCGFDRPVKGEPVQKGGSVTSNAATAGDSRPVGRRSREPRSGAGAAASPAAWSREESCPGKQSGSSASRCPHRHCWMPASRGASGRGSRSQGRILCFPRVSMACVLSVVPAAG